MAFFGLFKSKEESELEKMLKQMHDAIFPGGESDVLRDIERVTRYTNGKIPRDKIRGFVAGCKTLVLIGDKHDDEDFVRSFKIRSNNLISDAEANEVYVYFEGEASYAVNITKMAGAKGARPNSELRQHLAQMEETYATGTSKDSISGGYGEFGLAVTNPIPTISVKGSNTYLSRLRFKGQEVKNVRRGSTLSPVTTGNVDIYELTANGKEVGAVYICPYHRKNSKAVPNGFTLA